MNHSSPELKSRFEKLAEKWNEETKFLSSMSEINAHPSLRKIVAMGEAALPLILKRLEVQGGWWFGALYEISGENCIAPEDAGKYEVIKGKWLTWGRERQLI